MEEKPSSSSSSSFSRKRPQSEDEDRDIPPMAKRVRFPKGKKVKTEENEVPGGVIIGAAPRPPSPPPVIDLSDPRTAAQERIKRRVQHRSQFLSELFSEDDVLEIPKDVTRAEEKYQDNAGFVDDGIKIIPFNLNSEREEGYFDEDNNFVEYANENPIKDAWLDSVDIVSTYAAEKSGIADIEEDTPDLASEAIGKMKRRIADLLQPEETVLQALRRLKGTSTDRKEKMSEEIKLMFDQLTEDSMKLMDNGDYNVYHEKREVFEREAEGYERLARAKEGTSRMVDYGDSDYNAGKDIFSNGTNKGLASAPLSGPSSGPSDPNVSSTQHSSGNADEDFDMFGEDDVNTAIDPPTNPESDSRPSSENIQSNLESGNAENDYVYDESSGYYYNSTLGYYYDAASGLYCCANSGKWYTYSEQTSIYEEVQAETE